MTLVIGMNSGSSFDGIDAGFRIASIPEPGSITLLATAALALLTFTRRRRAP